MQTYTDDMFGKRQVSSTKQSSFTDIWGHVDGIYDVSGQCDRAAGTAGSLVSTKCEVGRLHWAGMELDRIVVLACETRWKQFASWAAIDCKWLVPLQLG
jgi:hypothetical protein